MSDEREVSSYPMYFVALVILGSLIAFIILFLITTNALSSPLFVV